MSTAVRGNYVTSAAGNGISLTGDFFSDVEVSENTVVGNGGDGIYFSVSAGATPEITVSRNLAVGNAKLGVDAPGSDRWRWQPSESERQSSPVRRCDLRTTAAPGLRPREALHSGLVGVR